MEVTRQHLASIISADLLNALITAVTICLLHQRDSSEINRRKHPNNYMLPMCQNVNQFGFSFCPCKLLFHLLYPLWELKCFAIVLQSFGRMVESYSSKMDCLHLQIRTSIPIYGTRELRTIPNEVRLWTQTAVNIKGLKVECLVKFQKTRMKKIHYYIISTVSLLLFYSILQ